MSALGDVVTHQTVYILIFIISIFNMPHAQGDVVTHQMANGSCVYYVMADPGDVMTHKWYTI